MGSLNGNGLNNENPKILGNGKKPKKDYIKPKKVKSKASIKAFYKEYKFCMCCGLDVNVSVHHIRFRSQGGDDSYGNLISLCLLCHRKAHDGYYTIKEVYISAKEFIIKVLYELNWNQYQEVLQYLESL